MISRTNVHGTQEKVPQLEINIDTVYIRSNIHQIEVQTDTKESRMEWEYNEEEYSLQEYLNKVLPENQATTDAAIVELSMLIASMQGA